MPIEEHVFTFAAEADFLQLYDRYGDRLYVVVDRAISQLLSHPESAPIVQGDIRRLVLPGTPFGLFYGVHGKRIAIVAILDLRQDPSSIKRRLKERS